MTWDPNIIPTDGMPCPRCESEHTHTQELQEPHEGTFMYCVDCKARWYPQLTTPAHVGGPGIDPTDDPHGLIEANAREPITAQRVADALRDGPYRDRFDGMPQAEFMDMCEAAAKHLDE